MENHAKLINERSTKKSTSGKQWEPPPGIRYVTNRQRPATPFLLRWEEDGKVRSQSFSDETDREDAAKALAAKRQDFGKEILNFDPKEWRRWLEFKDRAGDSDPMIILHEWQAWRASQGLAGGKPVSLTDAVTKYMIQRGKESLSPDTLRHFKKHLVQRFAAVHASLNLTDVTAEIIEKWLAALVRDKGAKKGQAMDAVTKRHHRKDVNTFLAWCVSPQGWLVRNPCDAVPVPVVEEEDVELLTVAEGRDLFAKNKGHRVLGRIALEAFGFLRASSAGRLRKENVNFADRGIRMLGPEHKSRKTKFRQGHPSNLWAWLDQAGADCWAMTPVQYRNEKHDAFVRAGIKGGSENRLRKTCLSAHLAWLKNQPLTSLLAQHRHSSTTEIYLGVMTEADGKAWFEIVP